MSPGKTTDSMACSQIARVSATTVTAVVLLVAAALQVATAEEPMRINGLTMGSYYSVVIDSPGKAVASDLQKLLEQDFAELTRQMSNWDRTSEISRWNRLQTDEWMAVSSEFAYVVSESVQLHHISKGAFDPTLGPVIELWGFGTGRNKTVPAADRIQHAFSAVGIGKLEVRQEPPALRKTLPAMQLNLSALVPGFAADRAAAILEEAGLSSFVVDIGGEVRAGRAKSDGSNWKLGVESPLGGMYKIVSLVENSVATSGDYRNFFEVNGRRYSHVFDPATGHPVENPPACVSVIHKSCMLADAWATTMMVLGPERGMQLAREQQFDVMFLQLDKSGKLSEVSSGLFAATPVHMQPPAQKKTPE